MSPRIVDFRIPSIGYLSSTHSILSAGQRQHRVTVVSPNMSLISTALMRLQRYLVIQSLNQSSQQAMDSWSLPRDRYSPPHSSMYHKYHQSISPAEEGSQVDTSAQLFQRCVSGGVSRIKRGHPVEWPRLDHITELNEKSRSLVWSEASYRKSLPVMKENFAGFRQQLLIPSLGLSGLSPLVDSELEREGGAKLIQGKHILAPRSSSMTSTGSSADVAFLLRYLILCQ